MDVGKSDALILPVPPEPFALIAGSAMHDVAADGLEQAIRRMGLQPEPWPGDDPDKLESVAAPQFRLRFGAISVLAGRAAAGALDIADPLHPSTSLLAASLPTDWRDGGKCWVIVPEAADMVQAPAEQAARMREFFKMMVLLIDLFDASHIFWSPARLWSDAPQFRTSIGEMLTSGMPPVLHLIAFRRQETPGGGAMATRGLALFSGQELESPIPRDWTVAEMVKRLARLAMDIMLNGPVEDERRLRGLYPGEWVRLSPLGTGDRRSTVLVEFGGDN